MNTKRRLVTTLIIVFVIVGLCLVVDYPKGPDLDWSKLGFKPKEGKTEESLKTPIKVHLGLDLQGGSQLVYQADLSNIKSTDYAEAMAGVRDVIERRINLFGVSEPKVQISGKDRLIVELAGIKDIDEAIAAIGETPTLEFMEEVEESSPAGSSEINIEPSGEEKAAGDTSESKSEKVPEEENRAKEVPKSSIRKTAQENGSTGTGDTSNGEGAGDAGEVSGEKGSEDSVDLSPEELEEIKKQLEVQGGGDIDLSGMLQQPQFKPTGLTGKNLKKAEVVFEQQGIGTPQVSLLFDDEGKKLFEEITERSVGKRVAIMIDGVIISAPTVQEKISEGTAVITGNFTLDEAKELARNLNAGALPVPISLISRQTVGATLGQESVQQSLIAGLIGLLVVCLFMIFYYRLPGVLAVFALMIYAIVVLALFKLIPVTLTLAGVAGFILAIGMAVDANVLIFERMREELRAGKNLGTAIDVGFKQAWNSIRDSNVSTLIICLVLYWFGTSVIKGFALTLGIGILVSMFSALTVTRVFLRLSAMSPAGKASWWFGMNKKSKG